MVQGAMRDKVVSASGAGGQVVSASGAGDPIPRGPHRTRWSVPVVQGTLYPGGHAGQVGQCQWCRGPYTQGATQDKFTCLTIVAGEKFSDCT